MRLDYGSRDKRFTDCVSEVRTGLCALAQGKNGESIADKFTSVILPGSGTNSVESVITSAVPRGGRILILVNGSYGQRQCAIAKQAGIEFDAMEFDWTKAMDVARVSEALAEKHYDVVSVVHHETTTGMVNPIAELGAAIRSPASRNPKAAYFIDAMSSFGGMDCDLSDCDYMVSSSNKCVQGVPGFGFILARPEVLETTEGNSRSLALDLHAQWKGLEKTGQFRFTPPVQAIVAFGQALKELHEEGLQGRIERYEKNQQTFHKGAAGLGLETLLEEKDMGPIISSYLQPAHPKFDFKTLYTRLSDKGFIIYPGSTFETKDRATLRVGHIGEITPEHTRELVGAFHEVYEEMGVAV